MDHVHTINIKNSLLLFYSLFRLSVALMHSFLFVMMTFHILCSYNIKDSFKNVSVLSFCSVLSHSVRIYIQYVLF